MRIIELHPIFVLVHLPAVRSQASIILMTTMKVPKQCCTYLANGKTKVSGLENIW
jgi:hypothetical protein